jgi:hypothetical protein
MKRLQKLLSVAAFSLTISVALADFGIILFNTSAQAQSLDLQATCAAQAKKAFYETEAEWKSDPYSKGFTTLSNDYQSHYNTKLKKCLMLVETTRLFANQQNITVYLTDAYERRIYANYQWISSPTKKYWEVPPSICELIPSLKDKRHCNSREEFDAFVADYMEE